MMGCNCEKVLIEAPTHFRIPIAAYHFLQDKNLVMLIHVLISSLNSA